ncbi:hypothetical protein MMC24_003448 [Lignoscripta atroalba]|nr:hypothetical protein [Lignoscripta atroalba]
MFQSEISSQDVLRSRSSSPLPLPATGMQITLQVGARRFSTTTETLTAGSAFFASLLSGRWDNVLVDGSYFIDADGSVFEHILRYLRHGVLPVFFDKSKGHDYALYLAVLEQAKYFQIDKLEEWIQNKRYLHAVKIEHSADEFEGTHAIAESVGADVDVEYHPTWKITKVYVCPRGIPSHRGNPNACGRICRNAQGNTEDEYEDEAVLKTVAIRRRIVFDQQICVEGR